MDNKLTVLDFAEGVENIRKRLIQHCKNNGRVISDNASLYTASATVQSILDPEDEHAGKFQVRWIDTDGTILKLEWLSPGESSTPPTTPNYDPDFLEFDHWVYTNINGANNITEHVDCGAIYHLKDSQKVTVNYEDTDIVCTPSILKVNINEATTLALNTTLKRNYTSTNYINYIDWGDGTVDTYTSSISTNTGASHTYGTYGNYIIKLYGINTSTLTELTSPSYLFVPKPGSSTPIKGVLGNADTSGLALTTAYIRGSLLNGAGGSGANDYGFYANYNLEVLDIIDSNDWGFYGYTGLQSCSKLKALILNEYCSGIGSSTYSLSGLKNLKAYIIPANMQTCPLPQYASTIETLIIPNSAINLKGSTMYPFSGLGSLKYLQLPANGSCTFSSAPSSFCSDCINLKILDFTRTPSLLNQLSSLSIVGASSGLETIYLPASTPANFLNMTSNGSLTKLKNIIIANTANCASIYINMPSNTTLRYINIPEATSMLKVYVSSSNNFENMLDLSGNTALTELNIVSWNPKCLVIPETVTKLSLSQTSNRYIQEIIIQGTITGGSIDARNTAAFFDWDKAKNILKRFNTTSDATHSLTLPINLKIDLLTTYVDINCNEVPSTDPSAMTFLEYLTDKGWTVSFAAAN